MPRPGERRITIGILGSLAFLLGGCQEPFEPIQPNDLVYSIYGHLEATADRQWVRVTPIRTSLTTSPGPIDAVVTLEEIETGARTIMTDSLVRYQPVNPGDTALYAHNFTTTMRMIPGRHYRLTAVRSDGAQASATVLIPVVENPRLVNAAGGGWGVVGVPYIAMAQAVFDLGAPCPLNSRYEEPLPIVSYGNGYDDPPVFRPAWPENARPSVIPPPPTQCNPVRSFYRIVASGAPWPWRFEGRQPGPLDSASNIEGGLGFLAGVHTIGIR